MPNVNLTNRQIEVLIAAAAYFETELEDRDDHGYADARRNLAVLGRAWEKLERARR